MAPRRNNNSNSNSIIVHQQKQIQQPQQQQQEIAQQQTFLLPTEFLAERVAEQELQFFNSQNFISNISSSSNNNASNMSPMQTSNAVANVGNNNNNNHNNSVVNGHNNNNNNGEQQYTRCCYPSGDCFKLDSPLIALDTDLGDCVRVLCNNENCSFGQFMHRECFDSWEQSVLVNLKSMGRARSWSDRQRTQNLWTKKGYDLIYKACGCKCGRGHLRKDLEWTAPTMQTSASQSNGGASAALAVKNGGAQFVGVNGSGGGGGGSNSAAGQRMLNGGGGGGGGGAGVLNGNCNDADEEKKRKKKRNRNNQKPTLALAPLNPSGYHPNSQQQQQQQQQQQHHQHHQQNGHAQNGVAQNGNAAVVAVNGNSSNNCSSNGNSLGNNVGNSNGGSSSSSNMNGTHLAPNPNVGVIGSGLHQAHNNQQQQQQQQQPQMALQQQQQQQQNVVATLNNIIIGNGNVLGLDLRARAGSLSSSGDGSGSTSPSASQSSVDISISPMHHQQQQLQQQLQQQQQQQQQHLQLQQQYQQSLLQNGLSKSILSSINGCVVGGPLQQQQSSLPPIGVGNNNNNTNNNINSSSNTNGLKHLSIFDQQHLVQQQKNKEVELYSERVRSTSGCNGIFSRRLDFSSFNLLPKTRLNSYQVKIEDEGNHGNDETRLFILSSLAQSQMSRVACILCEEPMLVFDRYPLVDGSFFLSPKQHSTGCIEVKYEGRALYLTCVCMSCLDATSASRVISCRFCADTWDGSNLVLGTMYAYDIFAAMPCCAERLKCNNCFKLLLHPQQRLNFYSDYSHCVTCPYCATQDTHFVKPLSFCYTKSNAVRHQQIA